MTHLTRREALASISAPFAARLTAAFGSSLAASLSASGNAIAASGRLELGEAEPFSFDGLAEIAREKAARPFSPLTSPHADVLDRIDYDEFQQIVFRREASLWAEREDAAPIQLFHLGKFFNEPADIHVVDGGSARKVIYKRDYFDMPDDHVARSLPEDIGYAGFRVMNREQDRDWLAFLGASYFRSSGELDQYGLSARAIAIDTALPKPEEFPRFTAFYMAAGDDGPESAVIHAILEGPSIAGAYRIACSRKSGVAMDIDCALFARTDIERLGIAPLTSMFWYGQINREQAGDWRPQIHDSEGLSIWAGSGERIWRPLNNPPGVMTNSFLDQGPRGFGLMQRDRDFENYQDDGVFYEKRPSLWVEPLGDWGPGSVQLVEIPTNDEIHDNIVAYWVSDAPVKAGARLDYRYRLHWVAQDPKPTALATVSKTFTGNGGAPGRPRPQGVTRFVVDFEGPALEPLKRGDLAVSVGMSRGSLHLQPSAYPVVGRKGRWRSIFDLAVDGAEPVDLRMALTNAKGIPVTETWMYQFFPAQRERSRA